MLYVQVNNSVYHVNVVHSSGRKSCVLLLLRVDQTISLSAHFAPSLVTQTTAILCFSGYWLKWNWHLQRIWQCCTNRRWRSRSLIVNLFTLISGVQGLLPTEPGLWLSTVIGHVHLLPRLSDQPTGRGHRVRPARTRRQVEEAGGAGCGCGCCSRQELSWATPAPTSLLIPPAHKQQVYSWPTTLLVNTLVPLYNLQSLLVFIKSSKFKYWHSYSI